MVGSVIGLIMFAIPSTRKNTDMPYSVNQTFIYMQTLSIVMQQFIIGMDFFCAKIKITKINWLIYTALIIIVTACK